MITSILPLLFLCFAGSFLSGTTLFQGNSPEATHTFTFPIGAYAFNPKYRMIFIAPHEVAENKKFSLSAANVELKKFWDITPEKVTLNEQKEQANPLFGAHINTIAMMGQSPLLTVASQPIIYCITHFQDPTKVSLIASPEFKDAAGMVSGGIIGLCTEAPLDVDISVPNKFYAAVKNHDGIFGGTGAGIAIGYLEATVEEIKEKEKIIERKTHLNLKQAAVVPVDINCPLLIANAPLAAIKNDDYKKNIAMHWSHGVQSLYAGFYVESGAQAYAGATALLMHHVTKQGEVTSTVLNKTAWSDKSIIAAISASVSVSIHDIQSMHTSTALDYLIVQGGNGTPEETRRCIYALPLVNDPSSDYCGRIAHKYIPPTPEWNGDKLPLLNRRFISIPADRPEETVTSDDVEARVGGGQLPGDIQHIEVHNDAVFAATKGEAAASSGVFISQAIFDATGRIKAWTPWHRAWNVRQQVYGFAIDWATAGLWVIQQDERQAKVSSTAWQEDAALAPIIKKSFKQEEGGINVILDIGNGWLCMGGLRKIVMIDVGDVHSHIEISGGALTTMGCIKTLATAKHDDASWLIAGGTGGVVATRLGEQNICFTSVGAYCNVRKIIVDGDYLYVMTPTIIDRIDLTEVCAQKEIKPVRVAHVHEMKYPAISSFADFVISSDFALVGSNIGLLRVGNGCSIQKAQSQDEINWTLVPMAESLGPITKIFVTSPTGNDIDIARVVPGGNVHVLNAYAGYHQSRIYRFAVQAGSIDNFSIVPIPDQFTNYEFSFFVTIGDYRSALVTDGAFFFLMRGAYAPKKSAPFLEVLPPGMQSGNGRFTNLSSTTVLKIVGAHSIESMIRASATGQWLLYGDFGIWTNE